MRLLDCCAVSATARFRGHRAPASKQSSADALRDHTDDCARSARPLHRARRSACWPSSRRSVGPRCAGPAEAREDNLGYAAALGSCTNTRSSPDGAIFATKVTVSAASRSAATPAAPSRPNVGARRPRASIASGSQWIDAIDLAPTGDVWVTTAISGAPNDVYVSRDDGATFRAGRPAVGENFLEERPRSHRNDRARVYASGYEVAPPTAHPKESVARWRPQLDDVPARRRGARGDAADRARSPRSIRVRSRHVLSRISVGASPRSRRSDRLYRTTDGGGATFTRRARRGRR